MAVARGKSGAESRAEHDLRTSTGVSSCPPWLILLLLELRLSHLQLLFCDQGGGELEGLCRGVVRCPAVMRDSAQARAAIFPR